MIKIFEDNTCKQARSVSYNYNFSKLTGEFARWGREQQDDPPYCEVGPELLDIELSLVADEEDLFDLPEEYKQVVHYGGCSGNCQFCYKGNTGYGNSAITINMPISVLERILQIVPPTLTQIAYGITDIDAHPQLWEIFHLTHQYGFVPNITVNGFRVQEEQATKLAKLCGAVSVSVVKERKSIGYRAIQRLRKAGLKQTNVHFLLSNETYDDAFDIINDLTTLDGGINAIVFLQYKNKINNNNFTPVISPAKYLRLVEHCEKNGVAYGFDSCSAFTFLKAIKLCDIDNENRQRLEQMVESCESTLFSLYINCFDEVFPCSFLEGEKDWQTGIRLLDYKNFSEIWNHPRLTEFRRHNLACKANEKCPCHYNL